MNRLETLLIAKQLFTTAWYEDACDRVLFSPESCRELHRIARETEAEIEDVEDVLRRWTRRERAETGSESKFVAQASRRDLLRLLIEAKEAAGESLEKTALLAPQEYREEILELAAIDFRHASELSRLLTQELERSASRPPE